MFYSNVIARSVNTFFTLGDGTINSSLVERGKLLRDPQPCSRLHFFVRMKPTSTNVFLDVAKNVKVTRGKIWTVGRMLKRFPHQIGSIRIGIIMQKDDSFRHHSRAFWLYGASQHLQPPRNEPHRSAILYFPPFPMLGEYTLHYAHLQSNKKQLCGPVSFRYACLEPYRWQYQYVTTVLPVFARNVFMECVRFSFDCPT